MSMFNVNDSELIVDVSQVLTSLSLTIYLNFRNVKCLFVCGQVFSVVVIDY